ncbi:MAG: hypoxanthine phosphoribosyltransferase [Lachnospiraceae bacterium]|nr:hypoxanthine phosphoribosyltransferase [Lachnospiraceae bacterium]MBR1875667.1 hypoxanthine phosphoribosyltransferase [Lachnospiraceae bacterium]
MGDKLKIMYTEEETNKRIRELGEQISRDYGDREITIICILKGASFFACELAKRIDNPVNMEFMRCSSYGNETQSSGEVRIVLDLDNPIKGKDVLVVEDIIDTGRTMKTLVGTLKNRGANSVKVCTLLDKPERRVVDIKADYTGFVIPDKFVVGYGLDYAQRHRNLPYIAEVEV